MRRLILALVALLALPSLASAAVAVVQTKSLLSATNPFITDGIADVTLDAPTTVGNYLVVYFYVPSSSSLTVTSVTVGATALGLCSDGVTNGNNEAAGVHEQWAYCGTVTASSAAVTVTLSAPVASGGIVHAVELSGQRKVNATEDIEKNFTTAAAGTKPAGFTTTAAGGNALLGFISGTTTTYTIDVDFTAFTGAQDSFGIAGAALFGTGGTRGFDSTTAGVATTLQMQIAIRADVAGGADYITRTEDTADLTTYTYASQAFGYAEASRYITVASFARKGGTTGCTVPTVTIGGVAATLVVGQANNPTNCNVAAIHKALVPSGLTGTIEVVYAATMTQAAIATYRSDGTQTVAADSSGSSIAADPTGTLTIAASGYGIGAAISSGTSTTATWTGLTENYDAVWGSGGTTTTTGALLTPSVLQSGITVTADFLTSPVESAGVWAAWSVGGAAGTTQMPSATVLGVGNEP